MQRLRIGVIGDPVEHSLSPIFQQPAIDAASIVTLANEAALPLLLIHDDDCDPPAFGEAVAPAAVGKTYRFGPS